MKRRLAFLIALCLLPRAAAADDPFCPDLPFPNDPATLEIFVSKNNNACAPGSYVRTGTSYDAHFRTITHASCDIYVWDTGIPGCRLDHTDDQGVGASSIIEYGVPGWSVIQTNPVSSFPLQLDTRQSNTSTPDTPTWNFGTEGQRVLRFQSTLENVCAGLEPSVEEDIAFNAVACIPKFNTVISGAIVHNEATQTPPIVVRVPPTMNLRMRTGIQNAVTRWNTALNLHGATVGPRYEYFESSTPCGGTRCINTQEGTVNLPGECAKGSLGTDPATGLIVSSTVTFPPQSSSWPQSFNDRLALHELGHHLGLDENTGGSCSSWYSVMKPITCGATFGYPTAPTVSDHLPPAWTTYQGGSMATCE